MHSPLLVATRAAFPLLLLLFAIGCATEPGEETELEVTAEEGVEALRTAAATLSPTEGYEATGEVTFAETENGVRVTATVQGLSEGQHGFHIHEHGDCSAPDASSAGGHFNPDGTPHGAPTAPADQRHMGDMGNLEAGTDGTTTYDRVDTVIDFDAILGKAVIVHGGADDLTSQPSGAAGPRVACGVSALGE